MENLYTLKKGWSEVGYYDDGEIYNLSRKFIGQYYNDGYVRQSGRIVGRCSSGLIKNADGGTLASYNYGEVRRDGRYVASYDGPDIGGAAAALLLILLEN